MVASVSNIHSVCSWMYCNAFWIIELIIILLPYLTTTQSQSANSWIVTVTIYHKKTIVKSNTSWLAPLPLLPSELYCYQGVVYHHY